MNQQLKNANRIVVKTGSSLVIGADGTPRENWLDALAHDIANLKTAGAAVVVVTSGAVALGRGAMGYGARALTLEEKQAAAACGQTTLFSLWDTALRRHGLCAAQILLTADDSENRRRYLNARNTLDTLLANPSIVPVINENDTVATAELRIGDNDRLAARVAQMAGAEMLVLLSDIDGLYTANPRTDASARHLERVEAITPEIEAMAGGAASAVSTGGMRTKIEAAKIASKAGCHTVIANGTENHALQAVADGGRATWFIAPESPLSARKHWISGSVQVTGAVVVDDGAATALHSGKSLLPAGVRAVEGVFERGDTVLIKDATGLILGRGLTAYSSQDAVKIMGRKSAEIEAILGFKGRDTLIHRDDMVMG